MKAIITKIDPPRLSKHNGMYQRVYMRSFDDQKTYRLDVYPGHSKSKRWVPYVKLQAVFDKVEIFKKDIVDGCSNFIFLGVKETAAEHVEPIKSGQ